MAEEPKPQRTPVYMTIIPEEIIGEPDNNGTPVRLRTIVDGKRTDYGNKIVAAQKGLVKAVDALPDYMHRVLAINKIVVHGPTTPGLAVIDDAKTSYTQAFYPTSNIIYIPLTDSKNPILVRGDFDAVPHEAQHGLSRVLGELAPKKFAGEGSLSINISEHPLFAEAYKRDLARISDNPDRKWAMDLEHYFPKEKGGAHDSKYNNHTARNEAFAQLATLIQLGKYPASDRIFGDKKNPSIYTNAIRQLFPNMLLVAEKFHADMERLSKENPDPEKYKAALKGFLETLPKTPDAYLNPTTVKSLAAMPPHTDPVIGTKEHTDNLLKATPVQEDVSSRKVGVPTRKVDEPVRQVDEPVRKRDPGNELIPKVEQDHKAPPKTLSPGKKVSPI